MISGLFFGLAFGVAGIGAALRGRMADAFGIELVYSRVRVSARHRPSDGVPAEHRAATAGPGNSRCRSSWTVARGQAQPA